jgi:CheY-like chemotaxis protein
MSMPVMDGMTSTRAIRQYEQAYSVPRCYIVALTGLASNSARLEAWNSGIDQYMTKPVNFKRLAEILGRERTRRDSVEENNLDA